MVSQAPRMTSSRPSTTSPTAQWMGFRSALVSGATLAVGSEGTGVHRSAVSSQRDSLRSRPSAPDRAGFSLFELILVLIILVTLASFAIPTLDAMVTSRRIRQSAERLQNELLEARVEAMKTGQAQVFRATIHGNGYSISPWLSGQEDSDASAGATLMTTGGVVKTERTDSGAAAASLVQPSVATKTLEPDVLFLGVETLVDARNALEIEKSGEMVPGVASAPSSGALSSPMLLYPDGSTTTGQILLADKRGRRMAIQIRGITGRSTTLQLSGTDPATIPEIIVANADSSEQGK